MGFELREALRRFCVEVGWSYAVFWRAIGFPSPKHLVWGDGHWFGKLQLPRIDDGNSHVNSSDQFQSLGWDGIDEMIKRTMLPQVHAIGVGIVGQAASTGSHCWILRNETGENESSLKQFPDVNNQFLAGIQTIVIIPVFPIGVVQFGSTKRVMENLLFVNHARTSLMQSVLESGSSIHCLTQNTLGPNSFPPYICPTIPDYQFRNNSSNVDRLLSHSLSSLSTQVKEKMSKFDAECLSNKEDVSVSSSSFMELHQPTINETRNILFHLNKQLENEVLDAQLSSNEDLMSLSEMPVTSGNPSFMEQNLLHPCGSRIQEPAFATENQCEKVEPMDRAKDIQRCTSAHTSENFPTHSNVSSANPVGVIRDINSLTRNHSIPVHSYTNNLLKKTRVSLPGYLKQGNAGIHSSGISSSSCGFPLIGEDCQFGASSIFEANQEIENAVCHGDDSCKVQKLKKICAESDPSFISMPNDLFDVLGLYDVVKTSRKQLIVDVPSCNTQLNLSPLLFSVENPISCTEVFSESKSDQLLDAVVSSVCQSTRWSSDETTSLNTSVKKVNGSSISCPSHSHNGSASSEQKQGDDVFCSLAKGNSEAACSTSVRTADLIDGTERPGYDKSNTCSWIESEKNMNCDNLFASHGTRVDEMGKLNRKRARPGETPRPRPKDRQLIMDRVRELREIVPNGAKCSIDALLEKTIKHMLFLQSVSKHADKLKRTGEPKIISKDGAVVLKDNLRGGATWAFEVGSQTMTCPIIVEDLNPPREMLVEMLCEERGLFLEIADLIRGLGLTILKGVMEARRDKIWARFAVEANRDVTRMEIFLSLVHLLEPTIGISIAPQSVHNNRKTPEKILNLQSVPATGMVSGTPR